MGRSWPCTLAKVGRRDRAGDPGSARGMFAGCLRWSSSSDTGVLNLVWDLSDLGVSVILAAQKAILCVGRSVGIKPACWIGLSVFLRQHKNHRKGRVACERSPLRHAQLDEGLRVGASPTLSRWKVKSGSQTSRPSPGREGFRGDSGSSGSSECV